jgi:hypothetical protein
MSIEEIVGFPKPPGDTSKDMPPARLDLIDELERVRQAEVARITEIAEQLSRQFGFAIAAGFLHVEILGRPPQSADWTRYIEGLRRTTLTVPAIVEELLAMAVSKEACSPAAARGADPGRPAG